MFKLYIDTVLEELKREHKVALTLKLHQEILDFKLDILLDHQAKKASLIFSKYELLTREYQNQNKNLKENHERIINSEQVKRQEIISNFENHLAQIRTQIREDADKLEADGGGDIVKENTMLKTQFDALMKEIDEKSLLMDNQIEEKEKTSGTIEEEMSKKIYQ